MNNYTNSYERPDWIKKENTRRLFDLFEKIMNEHDGEYIIDWHCSHRDNGRNYYSYYLIPKGNDLGYYGHPEGTIRLSNHWSWYSSIKKCNDINVVQCYLKGIEPRLRFPDRPEGATTPKWITQLAIVKNGIYVPLKY